MKNPLITALLIFTAVTAQAVDLASTYSENFDSMGTGTAPPAGWTFHALAGSSSDWTTSVIATGAGGGSANATLIASTTTGVSSNSAGYNFALAAATADRALATSPTSIKGAALQLTVTNTSGGPLNGVYVGYDTRRFSVSGGDNQLPGFWLFYSLDDGNTWTNVPAFNPTITSVPNTVGVTTTAPALVTFSSALANNSTVLFRWVDDNSQISPDQITGLDNVVISTQTSTTLIAKDSVWKYLDNGSDQGAPWRAAAFNDSTWLSGAAELGYADSPATPVSYGPDSNNKYITTYFRRAFNVANPATVSLLFMNLVRDDGAVIYLNGTEIARSNMSAGTVLYNTLGPSVVSDVAESTYFPVTFSVDPIPLLVPGTNVLAVEAHQQAVNSSDLSFNLELIAQTVPIGNPPTVAINSPPNAAAFTAPATVEIIAAATDTDGTISKVEFLRGATKLGEDSSAPYAFTASGLAAGNYSLTARATDNDGNVVTSAVVAIAVTTGLSGTLTRSPYLNSASHNSIVVRWRSSSSVIGRVRYGTAPDALNQFTDEPAARTDHEVKLTGLTPYTRYYYSVGSALGTLTPEAVETTNFSPGAPAPTAADYTFRTSPVPGTAVNTRIWIVGDCGRGTQTQASGRDAYYTSNFTGGFTGTRIPDLNLQLGDNAYNSGTDSEYQTGYFNMYANIFRKMPQMSTLGNHDANNTTPGVDGNYSYPYFDMFTFPTQGEIGGVASGTEHYYSFDYSNIHFICLDSNSSTRTVDNTATPGNEDGPMATWLRQDLASTTATWIVAFWHHPPYSKGSHNSDTEPAMVQMRTNFNPILENGGVDLVFLGHSHNYERSVLLNGHYGTSGTITKAMKKNSGNGSTTGFTTTANGKIRNAANSFTATATIAGTVIPPDGSYIKPLTGPRDHFGAVYNTAGMSGLADTGAIDHSAMYVSYNNVGTVNLDVNGNSLTCTFVQSGGDTPDNFTINKQGAADSDDDGISDAYEIANGLSRYTNDAADSTDSDGLSNFLEFAFGLNPNVHDGGFLEADVSGGILTKRGKPSPWYHTSTSGTDFRIVYLRRKDAAEAGLVYIPQFSGNLVNWADSAATPTVIADDGEVEAVSVEYPLFPAALGAGFFRLGVRTTH